MDFPVLKAVVQDEDIRVKAASFGEDADGGDAVGADGERGAAVAEQKLGLVAGDLDGKVLAREGGGGPAHGPAIAAGQHGGADAPGSELAAQPAHERRLAGTAHGEIANADHGAAEGARARA